LVLCQAKFLVKHSDYLMKGGIYFVPMVNVDGVKIAQEGVDFIDNKKLRKQLIEINGSKDFSLWKANANAVDLNTNFDAKWGQGETNLFFRSPSNYVGKCPCSEPESRALASFTERISPLATLSYHCKGEVIYWKFSQSKTRMARDARLAKGVSALTGYPLGNSDGSTGGYKDWCIDKLNISALTIEVGDDKFDHPFPYSEFESILNKNEDVPRKLLNTVVREKEKTMTAEEIVDLPRVLN
ncbi:MAG: M14 family zinc carboxypeptidase, partial [Clostridia bacterium]